MSPHPIYLQFPMRHMESPFDIPTPSNIAYGVTTISSSDVSTTSNAADGVTTIPHMQCR